MVRPRPVAVLAAPQGHERKKAGGDGPVRLLCIIRVSGGQGHPGRASGQIRLSLAARRAGAGASGRSAAPILGGREGRRTAPIQGLPGRGRTRRASAPGPSAASPSVAVGRSPSLRNRSSSPCPPRAHIAPRRRPRPRRRGRPPAARRRDRLGRRRRARAGLVRRLHRRFLRPCRAARPLGRLEPGVPAQPRRRADPPQRARRNPAGQPQPPAPFPPEVIAPDGASGDRAGSGRDDARASAPRRARRKRGPGVAPGPQPRAVRSARWPKRSARHFGWAAGACASTKSSTPLRFWSRRRPVTW